MFLVMFRTHLNKGDYAMSLRRRSSKRNKENQLPKPSIKQKMTEFLELPKEIVLNLPKITIVGDSNLLIENYKGVVEYDSNRVRINTGIGVVKIIGQSLIIKEITSEDIMVDGVINSFEIIR